MKLFLDACAIIYFVEMAEPHYKKFADKLHKIHNKHENTTFAASQLSLLECRVKPMREQNEELLGRYQQFFCATDLLLMPLTAPILEKATQLRAFHNLRTPDALQAATALSVDDDVIFVTGDSSFKKVKNLDILNV